MARLLVVEDEHHLAQGLCFNLEADGHEVSVIGDGETAWRRLVDERGAFDAVILDVMLPGKDGFEIASELRRSGDFVPILMLTARGRPEDVLQGFESGADDYLPKPFELAILLARVRGLLRRSAWSRPAMGRPGLGAEGGTESTPHRAEGGAERGAVGGMQGVTEGGIGAGMEGGTSVRLEPGPPRAPEVFNFGGNTFDLAALELRVGTMPYQLTVMEADLLHYLLKNAGKAVSRKAILEDVWDLHEDTDTRAIDNFIVRLRRFLNEDPAKPRHVLTVRGVGYKFIAEPNDKGGAA
jgi:DNA-binding response OmpR family regulator